jgi:hypothetical protein
MTGAVAMTTFTPDAAARLEHYLIDVRAALAGSPDVNADEIEADIRAHVDAEFRAEARPVTAVELEAVLVRLGPPEVWAVAADGAAPAARAVEPFDWSAFLTNVKRRILSIPATLWLGPEDWRLPYLGLGLFVLGLVLLPLFGFGVIFLAASYVVGRATAELAKEKGQPLGARRWLAYPGVIAFAVPLFLVVSFWPLLLVPGAVHEVSRAQFNVRYADETRLGVPRVQYVHPASPERVAADRKFLDAIPAKGDVAEVLAGAFAGVGALSGWWLVLGLVMWAFPKWPTAIFHPLLDGYTDWHGVKLAATAGIAFFIWCGFAFRFAERAGW